MVIEIRATAAHDFTISDFTMSDFTTNDPAVNSPIINNPIINNMGTRTVNKRETPVQNSTLSTGGRCATSHSVNSCGRQSAGEIVMGVGQSRLHPQSTALITSTIFLHHLEMTTMGECDHAVHV
jgi:hypothetical protein